MKFVSLSPVIFFYCCLAKAESELRIEVCTIPLREIIIDIAKPFVGNLQHVFVRGADKTGLNFEPKSPFGIFDGRAHISSRNYENARCETLVTARNVEEYNKTWQVFVDAFEEIARRYRYDVFLQNCKWATKKVLKNLGYQMPPSMEP